jgi:hypothetical protein
MVGNVEMLAIICLIVSAIRVYMVVKTETEMCCTAQTTGSEETAATAATGEMLWRNSRLHLSRCR